MKKWIVGILLIAFITGLWVGIYSGNPGPSTGKNDTISPDNSLNWNRIDNGAASGRIILNTSLPETPEKVLIYKTNQPIVNREAILALAKKFNISEPYQIKGSNEGFSIREVDKDIHVLIMNTGWMEYSNSPRHSVNSLDVPGNLPSDEEAEKIATAFLNERDLLPDDAEVRRIDHVKTYNLGNGGQETVVWEDVEVWYGRKLNGYPVEGTQLMLGIGAHGDPIEFISNWREYKPYQEMTVKNPGMAFNDLKTKGVSIGIHAPDNVSIDEMYLAYRTKAGADTEEYLEPVWMFKGNITANNKVIEPIHAYVPALTDDAVRSFSLS